MAGTVAAPGPQKRSGGRHRRVPKHGETEPDQSAAIASRWVWTLGRRIGRDPGALAYIPQVQKDFRDAVNYGYYVANKIGGFSLNEISRITGTKKQAVSLRVHEGEKVYNEMMAAEGGGVTVRIDTFRRQRAAAFLDAMMEDATAAPKQAAVYEELRRLRAVGE